MVITNQKLTIGIQKLKRKKHKHNTKENDQTTGEETKRKRTEKYYKNNQKASNKMATSTYLLIITLNVNRQNGPINRHSLTYWMKKTRLNKASLWN